MDVDHGRDADVRHGLRGSVSLAFARRGRRTVLVDSRIEAPMTVVRPLELADGRLMIQLITLGPGLCGGDSVRIDVHAGDGARVLITTTAASRIMSMETGAHAEQHVTLRVGEEATLEYYPLITIPFPGCALRQTVVVEAEATSRVGVLETWALGRTARREYLQFTSMSSRTTMSVDGQLRYSDATQLEPALNDLTGGAILAGHRYLATAFWQGATLAGRTIPPGCPPGVLMAFGQSRPGLVYLRALAGDGPALESALGLATTAVAGAWGQAGVKPGSDPEPGVKPGSDPEPGVKPGSDPGLTPRHAISRRW
jgi:urease accessory protein